MYKKHQKRKAGQVLHYLSHQWKSKTDVKKYFRWTYDTADKYVNYLYSQGLLKRQTGRRYGEIFYTRK